MKYSTKVDIVYRAIRSGIERGEYLPGDRIVISRIAKANGCSEIPVREALRRLLCPRRMVPYFPAAAF